MDQGLVILIQLGAWLAMGIICCVIARKRGRSALGWFFIGIVGGCLGLIMVLVLPDLKKEEEAKKRDKRRRRRLEEELTQERMKNQAFRGHASNRLDVHDEALGVDTRSAAGSVLPPPPVPQELEDGVPGEGWFLVTPGNDTEGPFDLEEMKKRIQSGHLADKTLVWHESLDDWTRVSASPLHRFLS